MSPVGTSAKAESPAQPEARGAWMRFTVGEEELAVPVAVIQEVASGKQLQEEAGAPPGLLGIVESQGRKVPVLDLAGHLEIPISGEGESYVLIVRVASRWLGLRVTSVLGLVVLALEDMRPLPQSARSGPTGEFLGAYPWEDRWLLLLDVDQFFSAAVGP